MKFHQTVCILVLELCFITFSSSAGIIFDRVVSESNYRESSKNQNLDSNLQENQLNRKIAIPQSDQSEENISSILELSHSSNHSDNDSQGTREKRQQVSVARTIGFNAPPGLGGLPPSTLCFEREVYGTCRYRTAPDECFQHEWTAYATIVNTGLNGYHKIYSIPEGLTVFPKGHPRVRVFLKSSCCNPIIQFIATDLFLQTDVCTVDVRELQDLHPGEIAGIVIGVLLFFIIIAVIVVVCLRRRKTKTIQKDTVIFGRSLTPSKSRSDFSGTKR